MTDVIDINYDTQIVQALEALDIKDNDAINQFLDSGLPTKKNEEYKYTDVAKFISASIDPDQLNDKPHQYNADKLKSHFYNEEGFHLVFFNGELDLTNSVLLNDEIKIEKGTNKGFSHTKMQKDVWSQLNKGIGKDSLLISVPKNTVSKPVFIYQFYSNQTHAIVSPSVYVKAETGSKIEIAEKTIIDEENNNTFSNKIYCFEVETNASVNFTSVQNYEPSLLEVNNIFANQAKDSRFYSNVFTFKGKLIRNNIYLDLLAENCESHMHGIYLLNGKSHVDNHTTVDHTLPNCMSNELYKGIVDEKAIAVFNGKIYVRPGAQQTNAYQTNNNISLADTATIHTKPQLEIWADDVKCSHGCTIGQLDEDAIFYLRARGIDSKMAKAMMLVAFAEEAFEFVPFEFLKEDLHLLINKRLIH